MLVHFPFFASSLRYACFLSSLRLGENRTEHTHSYCQWHCYCCYCSANVLEKQRRRRYFSIRMTVKKKTERKKSTVELFALARRNSAKKETTKKKKKEGRKRMTMNGKRDSCSRWRDPLSLFLVGTMICSLTMLTFVDVHFLDLSIGRRDHGIVYHETDDGLAAGQG